MKFFTQVYDRPIGDSKGNRIPFVRYGDRDDGIGLIELDENNADQVSTIADLEKAVSNGVGTIQPCTAEDAAEIKKKAVAPLSLPHSRSPFGRGNGLRLQAEMPHGPKTGAARAVADARLSHLNPAQAAAEATLGAPLSNPEPSTPPPRTRPNIGRPKPVVNE